VTALIAAWQAALAAEHQAVFGYGLLGPRLRGAQHNLAVTCEAVHEALRDAIEAAMAGSGVRPVQPRADYPELYPVRDAGQARALAARLEDDCAGAWRYLYAQAARGGAIMRMAQAQSALTASAVRATRWRLLVSPTDATRPFPGVRFD
jgi:hypothetical protein